MPPIGKRGGPAGKGLIRIELPDQVIVAVAVDVGDDPAAVALRLGISGQFGKRDRSARLAARQEPLADDQVAGLLPTEAAGDQASRRG